jgi:antibiotic biosynthesis monooxygenase (ABM) superfamily enzyme
VKDLRPRLRQLALWQKVTIAALLVIILLTWLAVCAILASYIV